MGVAASSGPRTAGSASETPSAGKDPPPGLRFLPGCRLRPRAEGARRDAALRRRADEGRGPASACGLLGPPGAAGAGGIAGFPSLPPVRSAGMSRRRAQSSRGRVVPGQGRASAASGGLPLGVEGEREGEARVPGVSPGWGGGKRDGQLQLPGESAAPSPPCRRLRHGSAEGSPRDVEPSCCPL